MLISETARAELDGKLAHGGAPFDPAPPSHAGIPDREVKQLERGIVIGKAAAGRSEERRVGKECRL